MGQTASSPVPGKRIQVIGAGLPRTGTASFSAALAILLDGPVYHGGTQVSMGPPPEIKSWIQILQNWVTRGPQERRTALNLLECRLDGYVAVTDSPGAQLVPELLELYPEAKVICTVRDPLAWEKSMGQVANLATLWFLRVVLLPLPGMRHFVDYISLLEAQWNGLYTHGRRHSHVWPTHIAWLKEVVPADRLVFVDVKDGWKPLCQALDMEVPQNVPFPHVNDSEGIDRTAAYHIRCGLTRWAGILVPCGVAVAAFAFYA